MILQVLQYDDPQEAAMAVTVESYKHWLTYENRTDDISVIVIFIKGIEPEWVALSIFSFLSFFMPSYCFSFFPSPCLVHRKLSDPNSEMILTSFKVREDIASAHLWVQNKDIQW